MSRFPHPGLLALALGAGLALLASVPAVAGDRDEGPGRAAGGCGQALTGAFAALPKAPVSAAERAAVIFLREEEKLARDVYRTLGTRWNVRVFTNITAAEQRHMDLVRDLLQHYEIPDPVASDATGAFTEPKLQRLYRELVTKGTLSLVDALQVGMTIEDMDIADLHALLALPDGNAHVRLVAQNLVKGSRNHLRAFARNLAAADGTYAAQFLEQAELDRLAASEHERGAVDGNGQPLATGACGQGAGNGAGNGRGRGRGQGRGACDGSGSGQGQGRGRGACDGSGSGQGQGRGRGACDGSGNGQGQGRGAGDGSGSGQGQGRGAGDGSGRGRGRGRGNG